MQRHSERTVQARKTALLQYFGVHPERQPAPEFVWYGSAADSGATVALSSSARALTGHRDRRRGQPPDWCWAAVERRAYDVGDVRAGMK